MSYDIRFGVKVEGAPENTYAVIGQPEYDSPTYNIREMFVKCMDWDFKQGEWYKITDVLPKVRHGVEELYVNKKKYKKYNSPNGWGDTDSALKCLRSIVDYFDDGWNGIGGTWNADIPYDCIYMRW